MAQRVLKSPHCSVQIIDKEAILKRWAEHFNSVLNRPSNINEDAIDIVEEKIQDKSLSFRFYAPRE